MQPPLNRSLTLGLCLAIGMILSSAVLGYAITRHAASKQAVAVKGLAEKEVKADRAQWTVAVQGSGKTLPDALANLRAHRPALLAFFREQGFPDAALTTERELFSPIYRIDAKGLPTREIETYEASQAITLDSNDVQRVAQAATQIVDLQEKGIPLAVGNPEYLVSALEKVKMSLIADATRNAHERASEFARSGNASVGPMRAASQGAFYILPARGASNDNEYGGTYDKSTIDKLARVVVTVEYTLAQ